MFPTRAVITVAAFTADLDTSLGIKAPVPLLRIDSPSDANAQDTTGRNGKAAGAVCLRHTDVGNEMGSMAMRPLCLQMQATVRCAAHTFWVELRGGVYSRLLTSSVLCGSPPGN